MAEYNKKEALYNELMDKLIEFGNQCEKIGGVNAYNRFVNLCNNTGDLDPKCYGTILNILGWAEEVGRLNGIQQCKDTLENIK